MTIIGEVKMYHSHVKKIFLLFLIGIVGSVFSGALCGQTLQIHYINVQQGQSTLIIGPNGTTILFDGGYEFKGTTEVVPYLQSIGIPASQSLDYIIASHRDTDHFVGLTEVITYGYNAYHVLDNGSDKTNTYVQAFLNAAATTTAGGVTAISLGTVIDLGYGATATCVAANGSVIGTGAISGGTSDENDRAICLLIKYNDFDFVLNGDMGGGASDSACTGRGTTQINMESPMLRAIMPAGVHPLLSQYGVEVAHVGHHGSESSTNSDYMNILTPKVACISVGAGQSSSYAHPRIDVVEHVLLAETSCITAPAALVLQTEEGSPAGASTSFAGNCVGDIVITTDGVNSYTVNADGAVSQGPDERVAAGLPVTYYFEEYSAVDYPPIIYNVYYQNSTFTSTEIVWSTNETASSLVRYGIATGSYTNTASNASLVLNHLIALSSLAPTTTYYYVVESTDATGNTTTSPEYTFQTNSATSDGVVFSEVFYDPPGTETLREWIELYNNSAAAADIGGWTITDNNGLGTTFTIPAGTTMTPNSYLTIATDAAGFLALYGYNADIGDPSNTFPSLNNAGEALILKNSSAVVKDAIGWEGGAGGGLPAGWGSTTLPNAPEGSTIVRSPVTTDTNTYADWALATNNGNPQTQPIVVSSITVTSPNGGENWIIGTAYNITWTSTGTVSSLNIDYSTNNGTNWTSIATGEANDGSFSWTIPSVTPSTTCLVRVQEADASPTDASNAVFTISVSTPPATGVVFSEVYYDTIGTDAVEEWIELYNKTAVIMNIGGWTITDNYPAGGHVTIPAGTTIAPYSHLTVAANSAGFRNIYAYEADLYYGTAIALGNGGDALLLKDSLGGLVDAVSWEGGTSGGIPAGWGSTTLPTASTGYTIVRADLTVDTNTYADWTTARNNGYPQTQRHYTLTIIAGDGGTTNPAPETYTYDEGIRVNITGTASTGYRFGSWSGDASGSTSPTSVMMNGNKTVTANFIRQYTLTIAASAGGTTNPVPGVYTYDEGTTVNIQGTASAGYQFGSWSGDASGSANPVSVTMDRDRTVTANFIRQYTLTIAAGAGGTTDPVPGAYTYDEGTTVNIQATASTGYRFGSWSGDVSGSANPASVTMDRDKTVTANFIRQYTLTIVAGEGGSTNPVPRTYPYDEGERINIQATASTGYRFGSWSGDASGTTNPVTIMMNGNKTVTANFIRGYTLTIVASTGGTTNPAPGTNTHDIGTSVSIQALPFAGYEFAAWSGNASGSANPVTVVVNGDMAVQANFTRVVQAPFGLTGEKLLNRTVSMIEYIVRLRWQSNPENTGAISYRIYHIENGQVTAIANVGSGTYEFIVHRLQAEKAYRFGVTAINSQGLESDMVQVAVQ
jgi:beta-lactamase superfamily II metal-dependent hydrolase